MFIGDSNSVTVTSKLPSTSAMDDDNAGSVCEFSSSTTSDVLKDLFNQKKQAFVTKLSSVDAEVSQWSPVVQLDQNFDFFSPGKNCYRCEVFSPKLSIVSLCFMASNGNFGENNVRKY